MHRFFVEPKSLSEDRSVWLMPRDDDIRWRIRVDSFRRHIKARQWKVIDLHLKLRVKVEVWEGKAVLIEDLENRSEYFLASAYLRAGLLENTPIIVFADGSIPWERLKPFRAANGCRDRHKDGAPGPKRCVALVPVPERAIEVWRGEPWTLANRIARTGKRDILAGECRTPPQARPAALDGRKVKPSSQSAALAGRPGDIPQGSPGRGVERPRLHDKS